MDVPIPTGVSAIDTNLNRYVTNAFIRGSSPPNTNISISLSSSNSLVLLPPKPGK